MDPRTSERPPRDGHVNYPEVECPRGRSDCCVLSVTASEERDTFMCCGHNHTAPVPEDVFRLCIKSVHENPVDVLVNLDHRDVVDVASVLMDGLSWDANWRLAGELMTDPPTQDTGEDDGE